MEIIKAEKAGFCFGVANAVDKTFEILDNKRDDMFVFSYGELIHNDNVINKLAQKGMRVVHTVEEIFTETNGHPEKATVIIRAHGISPEKQREIESSGKKFLFH